MNKDLEGQQKGQDGAQDEGSKDNSSKSYDEAYVRQLRKENADWRSKVRRADEKVSEFQAKLDSFDVEKYNELLKSHEQNELQKEESKGNWEKLKEKMAKAHSDELAQLTGKMTESQKAHEALEQELNSTILGNAISLEAAKAKALNPQIVQMALMAQAKVEKTEDGKRIIRLYDEFGEELVNPKSGKPMTVAERIAEMKVSQDYAFMFEGARPGGGSGTMTRDGRPDFSKMTWEQKLAYERAQMFENRS